MALELVCRGGPQKNDVVSYLPPAPEQRSAQHKRIDGSAKYMACVPHSGATTFDNAQPRTLRAVRQAVVTHAYTPFCP